MFSLCAEVQAWLAAPAITIIINTDWVLVLVCSYSAGDINCLVNDKTFNPTGCKCHHEQQTELFCLAFGTLTFYSLTCLSPSDVVIHFLVFINKSAFRLFAKNNIFVNKLQYEGDYARSSACTYMWNITFVLQKHISTFLLILLQTEQRKEKN